MHCRRVVVGTGQVSPFSPLPSIPCMGTLDHVSLGNTKTLPPASMAPQALAAVSLPAAPPVNLNHRHQGHSPHWDGLR